MILLLILIIPFTARGQFKNVTRASGILHHHAQANLLGGGTAFIDFDGDGWLDIYMTGGDQPDKLYRNLTQNQFEDQSFLLPHNQTEKTDNTSAVAIGDLDNNGCDEIIITTYNKEASNILLKNNCDGTFEDISTSAGLLDATESIGVALLDFDLDGLLDIYIINYVDSLAFLTDESGEVIGYDHFCAPNYLYRNLGDLQFEEVGAELGAQGNGCALAIAPLVQEDGQQALYVANDFGEFLKHNEYFLFDESQDTFLEQSVELGLDVALFGMGIAVGDYDNDLDLDLYVTNMGDNVFMINENNDYTDQASGYGIENGVTEDNRLTTGWGTFFFDKDNDTDLDLFVANGYIPAASFLNNAFIDPSKLYENVNSRFIDVSEQEGVDFIGPNRGCIYGDTDRDGDLDILLTNIVPNGPVDYNSTYKLLENRDNSRNHFLDIQLKGISNNRNGFGTRLFLNHGGKKYMQYALSGGSHASQNSTMVHFGLGDSEMADSLEVLWPNGLRDVFYNLPADKTLRIEESSMQYDILGCLNPNAENFDASATLDWGCANLITSDDHRVITPVSYKIYPTLSTGTLTVLQETSSVNNLMEVRNSLGQLVQSVRLHGPSTQQLIQLNPQMPNGVYWIKIMDTDELLFNSKFILSR